MVDAGRNHPSEGALNLLRKRGGRNVPVVDLLSAQGVPDASTDDPGALPRIAELLTNFEHRPSDLLAEDAVWHEDSITLGKNRRNSRGRQLAREPNGVTLVRLPPSPPPTIQ